MVKKKLKEWLKRYLPAEIVGTVTALAAAVIAKFYSDNLIFTAYAGSIGEAIGFYSTILFQNILQETRRRKIENQSLKASDFVKIVTRIVLEFGPAGLIDGLFLRPLLMFIFPVLLNNFTIGILVGKIAGDFTFYILVILSYEFASRKKIR